MNKENLDKLLNSKNTGFTFLGFYTMKVVLKDGTLTVLNSFKEEGFNMFVMSDDDVLTSL